MPGLTDLAVQDDPFDYYAQKHRTGCPVWHEPDIDLTVIGSMAHAREALTDVATFSSAPTRRTASPNPVAVAYVTELARRGWARAVTLQRTDPPIHTGYRKVLNRVFTPARVRALTPGIDAIVDHLIEPMIERGTTEFVADLALPLPGMFIAEQLGLDRSQYKTFRRWAEAMLCLANRPTMSMDEAMVEVEVELEAQHYLAAECEKRRAQPTDDLISLIVHAHEDDGEPFTMSELQDLMHQLVTGGFETTTAGLSAAMLLLVEHPDQQRLLRDRPELLSNFVEESLRFDSPVQGLWRRAACPASIGGVEVPEGGSVMVRYGAANRDPSVFDEPDRFDIERSNAKEHIAFGLGAHFCLGAALARQEMMSAFRALLKRTSWIELDGPLPSPLHDPSIFLRPMTRLPLVLHTA